MRFDYLKGINDLASIRLNLCLNILALFATLSLSLSTQAAEQAIPVKLTRIQGGVMIDTAGQYQPVTVGTTITSDTKILMQRSSSAELIYPSGCSLSIKGDRIYKPGNENNCKIGTPITVAVNDTGAIGAVGASEATDDRFSKTNLLFGAAALGAIGAAASSRQSPSPSP